MLKYLKSAFWLRWRVPLLGSVPVNALLLAAAGIVGIAAPWIWPLAIGVEVAYLAVLSGNRRFQRLVDAEDSLSREQQALTQRQALIDRLPAPAKARLGELRERCGKALAIQRDAGAEAFVVESTQQAFDNLQWIYVKLLVARQHLESEDMDQARHRLERQIRELERDVADEKVSPTVRESKAATLELLRRRMEMLHRKEESLQAIESDLMRIEAQVDLATEQARLRRTPAEISSNLGLVSQLLDDDLYGESSAVVASVDRALQRA